MHERERGPKGESGKVEERKDKEQPKKNIERGREYA